MNPHSILSNAFAKSRNAMMPSNWCFFLVTNGIKQGGTLSPCLFNVYMNNLSLSLNSLGRADSLGDNIINHLCYANDI